MDQQPFPSIVRSEGVTRSERYLHALCNDSFLSLWSHAGVFRDQGQKKGGDGKEVCDVLVVFGDDLVIFSDKDCEFPDSGSLELDWSRWFRRAILKSAHQAWGAIRWISEHPDRLFVDRTCTQRFPIDLPPRERMRFHSIVVAHGSTERCQRHFGDGSGTLIYNSQINGKMHHDPQTCVPFQVGVIDQREAFVHVLDDVSVEILLRCRDTITDFVDYLRAKESYIQELAAKGIPLIVTGEEELLAKYLMTFVNDKHALSIPDGAKVVLVEEGYWQHFTSSPQRRAQFEADQVSYLWDGLIEKFNQNILGGKGHYNSHPRIADREKTIRFFAGEGRVRRRVLADVLFSRMTSSQPLERRRTLIFPSTLGDPYYCFLFLPRFPDQPEEEYRAARRAELQALCLVTKLVCRDAKDIVGLATEPTPDLQNAVSEDACYLDVREWTDELNAQAEQLQKDFQIMVNPSRTEDIISEFPVS